MCGCIADRFLHHPEQLPRDIRAERNTITHHEKLRPGVARRGGPLQFQPDGLFERVPIEHRRSETSYRTSGLIERGDGRRTCLVEAHRDVVPESRGPPCRIEMEENRSDAPAHGVVNVARGPLPLGGDSDRGGALCRGRVQSGVRDRNGGMRCEQLEQLRIGLVECPTLHFTEHDTHTDQGGANANGNADHRMPESRVSGSDVAAWHIGVTLERHRASRAHYGTGDPLVDRKYLARAASDTEIDIFAVDPRFLVDRADRPALAAQQFDGIRENALKKRLQPKLARQVSREIGESGDLAMQSVARQRIAS